MPQTCDVDYKADTTRFSACQHIGMSQTPFFPPNKREKKRNKYLLGKNNKCLLGKNKKPVFFLSSKNARSKVYSSEIG